VQSRNPPYRTRIVVLVSAGGSHLAARSRFRWGWPTWRRPRRAGWPGDAGPQTVELCGERAAFVDTRSDQRTPVLSWLRAVRLDGGRCEALSAPSSQSEPPRVGQTRGGTCTGRSADGDGGIARIAISNGAIFRFSRWIEVALRLFVQTAGYSCVSPRLLFFVRPSRAVALDSASPSHTDFE